MYDYMDGEFWTEVFIAAEAKAAPAAIPVRKPPTQEELRLLHQVLAERSVSPLDNGGGDVVESESSNA